MPRVRSFFASYLITCGLIANAVGVLILVILASTDTVEFKAAARQGIPGLLRIVWKPLSAVDRTLAEQKAESVGLIAVSDAAQRPATLVAVESELGYGRVLSVGPGREFARPSGVAAHVLPGDIVEIDAGNYSGDTAVWRTNDVIIRGVGGMAHMRGEGVKLIQDKAIWLIQGDNVRIENVEFSGARSHDGNGAGIRAEGDRLHVVSCFFHDNETGILSNPIIDGSLLIETSEFARNGHANGQAHQIYVNAMERFELRYSYVHDSFVGSAVKSRARDNRISYNRIVDGLVGSSNYSVDLSNGGYAVLVGNVIEQGPRSENDELIAFAPEAPGGAAHELLVVHNTLVNDRHTGVFVRNFSAGLAYLYNNLLLGSGSAVRGPALALGNVVVRDGPLAIPNIDLGGIEGSGHNQVRTGTAVARRAHLDYRLTENSPARDAGVELQDTAELALRPSQEYRHPLRFRQRVQDGAPDSGALEYRPWSGRSLSNEG